MNVNVMRVLILFRNYSNNAQIIAVVILNRSKY